MGWDAGCSAGSGQPYFHRPRQDRPARNTDWTLFFREKTKVSALWRTGQGNPSKSTKGIKPKGASSSVEVATPRAATDSAAEQHLEVGFSDPIHPSDTAT